MTVKPVPAYIHAVVKASGNAGSAYEFLSLFNPSNSGKVLVALGVTIDSYAIAAASSPEPMQVYRTTAASGGTLIAAANVNRFDPLHPNPKAEVRIGNPTVTKIGLALVAFPPVVSVGTGSNGASASPTPGASFIIYPGTGVSFGTADGDVDQIWNLQFIWGELG